MFSSLRLTSEASGVLMLANTATPLRQCQTSVYVHQAIARWNRDDGRCLQLRQFEADRGDFLPPFLSYKRTRQARSARPFSFRPSSQGRRERRRTTRLAGTPGPSQEFPLPSVLSTKRDLHAVVR